MRTINRHGDYIECAFEGKDTCMFATVALKSTSILLAYDLTLVREGLAALCHAQGRYQVVSQCSDGTTAFKMIESDKPEITVLDLDLSGMSALEILRRSREAQIQTRMVILCPRNERKFVLEVLRSGANALVLKSDSADHLFEAFDQILDGGIYISPSFQSSNVFASGKRHIPDNPLTILSIRERQVFSLLIEGNRAKEVAVRLGLSAKTIDTYRVNLMRKLDIGNLAGLVRFAIERGVA
jgi:DNA-binding NarL/FixJ family response regulator